MQNSKWINTNNELLASKKHCVANLCTCENGDPVDIENCDEDGKHKCKSCSQYSNTTAGYHLVLETNHCEMNQCTCGNGTAVEDFKCTQHEANECASCDPGVFNKTVGYYLSEGFGSTCLPISCSCEFGDAISDELCPSHDWNHCVSCDEGYRLIGTICEPNVCLCENGSPRKTGITIDICGQNGRNECQECNSDFKLDGNSTAPICIVKCPAGYEGNDCQISLDVWARYPGPDVNSAIDMVLSYSGSTTKLYYTIG